MIIKSYQSQAKNSRAEDRLIVHVRYNISLNQLEFLATLVEGYEAKMESIDFVRSIEAFLHLLELGNLEASEFMAGLKQRRVSDEVIRFRKSVFVRSPETP